MSKVEVLDRGIVELISTSNNDKVIQPLQDRFFRGKINKSVIDAATAMFYVKCPLFVQLHLSQYGLSMIPLPGEVDAEVETYVPDISEISTGDTDVDRDICDHIRSTSESIKISMLAFQKDNCNRAMSQVIAPVNVYHELLISGTIPCWVSFLRRKKLPPPISAYQTTIGDLIKSEWQYIEVYKRGL